MTDTFFKPGLAHKNNLGASASDHKCHISSKICRLKEKKWQQFQEKATHVQYPAHVASQRLHAKSCVTAHLLHKLPMYSLLLTAGLQRREVKL